MIETVMTYEQWKAEYTRRTKANRKRLINYYKRVIPQKILGLLLIVGSILLMPVFKGEDATGLFIGIIIGLILLFNRDIWFGGR